MHKHRDRKILRKWGLKEEMKIMKKVGFFTIKGDEFQRPMNPNVFDERLDNAVEAWP